MNITVTVKNDEDNKVRVLKGTGLITIVTTRDDEGQNFLVQNVVRGFGGSPDGIFAAVIALTHAVAKGMMRNNGASYEEVEELMVSAIAEGLIQLKEGTVKMTDYNE